MRARGGRGEGEAGGDPEITSIASTNAARTASSSGAELSLCTAATPAVTPARAACVTEAGRLVMWSRPR
jgi:hypothetical protein